MPRPYPREFRDDVVRVARNRGPGVSIKDVAADFGISESCLNGWLRRADVEDGEAGGIEGSDPGHELGILHVDVDRAVEVAFGELLRGAHVDDLGARRRHDLGEAQSIDPLGSRRCGDGSTRPLGDGIRSRSGLGRAADQADGDGDEQGGAEGEGSCLHTP